MNYFQSGQRIKVVEGPLKGCMGSVVRVKMSTSQEAWVKIDKPLPPAMRSFGPEDNRADHICLSIEDCEEAV